MDISGEKASAAHPTTVAFQDVYRVHFRLVWRARAKLGIPQADRMDLTQNVFIIVHRQLAGFQGRSELTTWLCAICRYVARDYLRSARVRREVVLDARDIAQRMINSGDGLLQPPNSQDLSLLLESVLNRLPEKLRLVFVMFELDELSGDEIAHLLNLRVGTVRSRLRLAREVVQRQMRVHREPEAEAPLER
jgi:RNA polymerase sigma-70 factor (ECF subfamily)